ncbi:MAG: endopeptidase La [Acidobacteriota bacterium]
MAQEPEVLKIPDVLPVLPLKDTVVFPYIIVPLSISQDPSVLAVDRALAEDRLIMLVAQRAADETAGDDEPTSEDLHAVGTVAVIMRMLKLPDGRIRILVQGHSRARIEHIGQTAPYFQARITPIPEPAGPEAGAIDQEAEADDSSEDSEHGELEIAALVRSVKDDLDRASGLGKSISPEVMVIAANLEQPGRLSDLAASNLELKLGEAQEILETFDPAERLRRVGALLAREIQLLTMQHEISNQARGEMDRSQREYYLRQQLKAIQDELGEGDELTAEIRAYREAAREKELPDSALEELERQIRRLERSHPESAETSIIRTYLDWMTALPWNKTSTDRLDLGAAQKVLDEDHFGLEKIKERILEYLAVRKLKADARGPLLCFVGPPGVGKTSLGRSIARALDREFVRISLGGVRDEAEIRGHRRTYVGALPGRILQGLRQADTGNPVFMLDEIDKVGADYRGDPSSALLEVLDPEQNSTFVDHYLGMPYDLSKVLFIATANLLDPIQPAFLDRMEVLRLSGYTAAEKLEIARRHLVPKQIAEHGLSPEQMEITEPGIVRIISDYTREAGLRNLERSIGGLCRKVAVEVARGREEGRELEEPRSLGSEDVARLLGPPSHHSEELLRDDRIGVSTGLAWTAAGGDLMFIEAVAVPGKGKIVLTGQLGEVMQESAQAAVSYARSYAAHHPAAADDFFATHDIHIHAPAGSIPKDGPSAGITIAAAVVSVLVGRPVDRRIAMTGEITLRGDVLPIGGLKEKVMAAKLAGVTSIALPKLNERDLPEVPEAIKRGIEFRFVETVDQVLDLVLLRAPARKAKRSTKKKRTATSKKATSEARTPAGLGASTR